MPAKKKAHERAAGGPIGWEDGRLSVTALDLEPNPLVVAAILLRPVIGILDFLTALGAQPNILRLRGSRVRHGFRLLALLVSL
jgi:hypothetical protein